MSWDDSSSRRSLKSLQSLRALEPSWVITIFFSISVCFVSHGFCQTHRASQPCGMPSRQFSMTWQWSEMKKNVPLFGRLICIPTRPEFCQSHYSSLRVFLSECGEQTISMARQMMQRNALAEIHSPLIERLPVQRQIHVMLQVNTDICSSRNGPKCGAQFLVMNPDLNVFSVKKLVQPASVIEVHVSEDAFLRQVLLSRTKS